MLTLVIDSCTDRGIVSLVEDGHVVYMAGLPFGLHNSRYLVPKVDEGLESIHKSSNDLDLIAVANGPGSYTGIRASVVVAKSLSYANKTPLVGVSSLVGFIPDHEGTFASIIDAKMAGCFLLKGESKDGKVTYTSKPEIWQIEHVGEQLEGIEMLVTPHGAAFQEKLQSQYPDANWQWQETGPDPLHIAERANERFQGGHYSTDGTVEILYMR